MEQNSNTPKPTVLHLKVQRIVKSPTHAAKALARYVIYFCDLAIDGRPAKIEGFQLYGHGDNAETLTITPPCVSYGHKKGFMPIVSLPALAFRTIEGLIIYAYRSGLREYWPDHEDMNVIDE